MERNDKKLAGRVSLVGMGTNLTLFIIKLAAGIIASSGAMISEAVNSASDVFSAVIAMIGIKMAGREADSDHPYGHDRIECVASIILAFILFITGALIGYGCINNLFLSDDEEIVIPGVLALVAAVITIVTKAILYRYTIKAADKLNSVALRASAADHKWDAFGSIGTFIGIFGARLGVPALDPIAGLVICVFIIKNAVGIFREAVDKTIDRSCCGEIEETIHDIIKSVPGVLRVDLLRTRQFGSGIYVEAEISVNDELTVTKAHSISELVHDAVEDGEPAVRHCIVHVNPYSENDNGIGKDDANNRNDSRDNE